MKKKPNSVYIEFAGTLTRIIGQCHADNEDHDLKKTYEIIFACKKCKKVFKKDMREFEEQDEYCPHCDNHYALPFGESQGRLVVSLEGTQDMVRDEREKPKHKDTLEHMGEGLAGSRDAAVYHTFES